MATITVVFISGFLAPTHWRSHSADAVPDHVDFITANPSPTGSLHDRACQIFYELYGGTVDYGEEHSSFHKHGRYGRTFPGKLKQWGPNCPIILIGHSLGGNTAWVLHNYLATKKFNGIDTSAEWVAGIICVNAPLNGALQVHAKGMDVLRPPIVRWGSLGCCVGWFAQWSEYFNIVAVKHLLDFQHEHWNLTWREPSALYKLILSIFGYCLHSGTDNVAYDVTVRSQLAWAKVLRTLPSTFYISVVGHLPAPTRSWLRTIMSWMLCSASPRRLYGIDTSRWLDCGSDGLLSVHTQEHPRLATAMPQCSACAIITPATDNQPQRRKASTGRRSSPASCIGRRLVHECIQLEESAILHGDVKLRRGVWHSVHREMSHLTAALVCDNTWTLLMRAVQVIVDNHQRSPRKNRRATPPTASCRAPLGQCACVPSMPDGSPDRQAPHIGHAVTAADHSSLGMDYLWENIATAAALFGVLLYSHWGLPWNAPECTLSALYLLLMAAAVCHLLRKHPLSAEVSPPDLPNHTHYYADALAVAFAAARVLLLAASVRDSSSAGAIAPLSRHLLLWEAALQYLLPRPVLDYGLPSYATVLAILLSTSTHQRVWGRLNTLIIQVVPLVLTVLPKASWTVIYLAEKMGQRWQASAITIGRDMLVWTATAACAACWVCLASAVYHIWVASGEGEGEGGQWRTAEVMTMGLFGLLPLRWFQDQSECFQYVMILRHYSPRAPASGREKKLR